MGFVALSAFTSIIMLEGLDSVENYFAKGVFFVTSVLVAIRSKIIDSGVKVVEVVVNGILLNPGKYQLVEE